MNKRQIDFDVRVLTRNQGGINGAFRHEQMVEWIHQEYPTHLGWEVANVENIQLSADGVSVMLFLARYEWFDDAGTDTGSETEVAVTEKRKRGRPAKVSVPDGITEAA